LGGNKVFMLNSFRIFSGFLAIVLGLHWANRSVHAGEAPATQPASIFDFDGDPAKKAPAPTSEEKEKVPPRPAAAAPKPPDPPAAALPPVPLKWEGIRITQATPKAAVVAPAAPAPAAVVKAGEVLRAMYTEEFADESIRSRRGLGKKLLELGLATRTDPPARQAALQAAQELAEETGDSPTAQAAEEAIAKDRTKTIPTTQPTIISEPKETPGESVFDNPPTPSSSRH
jgi:hypothetical protein